MDMQNNEYLIKEIDKAKKELKKELKENDIRVRL